MEKILGYSIIEQIGDAGGVCSYRVENSDNQGTLIIKVLKTKYHSPAEIARFLQEYAIIQRIEIEGVVKAIDVKRDKGNVALILDDFDGVSLRSCIDEKKFDTTTFLKIAIQVSETLGNLHENDVVHKNLTPHSILWNKTGGKARITDFGAIAELTHQNEAIYDAQVIRESIAYMSPEQTGRMNRTVDYRTDLYSLGVVFYEMLTGHIPFESDDPLGMIYSHIARKPLPPAKLNSEIPAPVSDIVMRLLSKTAEERYQNGYGLMVDLKRCLDQHRSTGNIESFELGQRDVSVKFRIPEKLVGREYEIDTLMSAFDRVSRGEKEIMLVSGYPGVGKSALVNEVHKPIVAKKGYFIFGKCEPLRRDLPYSSIINALQKLVRQILKESPKRVDIWRQELTKALGNKGRVVTDVLPEIELIIGKQPDVIELSPEESQNRFNRVFRSFTRVFAKQEHPFVLFLDDLQWADSASLHLMENLITDPDIQFLFLIGAYRDIEVSESHPLQKIVKNFKHAGLSVHEISLSPLNVSHVNRIIADLFKADAEESLPLAQILYSKTGGNPFFVKQFMETLYQEGFLILNPATGWHWNMNKIQQMQVTDNVVDLMVAKIIGLPVNERMMLEVCACIGNRFDLETLSDALDKSIASTLGHLNNSISNGLINISDDTYMFHHDRIHEAAYSLIPKERQAELHLRIGRLVLNKTNEEELKDKIYYIVNQLNLGVDSLSKTDERVELARLNLAAGLKAKASTAYEAAYRFFTQGIGLIPPDGWETHYNLTVALYLGGGEVAYLIGDQARGDRLLDAVLDRAKSSLDKVRVCEIKISSYTSLHRYEEALQFGRAGLKLLGVTLPRGFTRFHVVRELLMAKHMMRNRSIEELIDLPELTDPRTLAVARILMLCTHPSYIGRPDFLVIIILKLLNLTLKQGNSSYAAYAYAAYAAALCGILGDVQRGYRFGKLAVRVLDKFNADELRCKVYFILGNYVNHWTGPVKQSVDYFLRAYKSGIATGGDLSYVSMALVHYGIVSFWSAGTLDEVAKWYGQHYEEMKQFRQVRSIQAYELWHQLMLHVLGRTKENKLVVKGEICDEREVVSEWIRLNNFTTLGYFTVTKQFLSYLCNTVDKSLDFASQARNYLKSMSGTILVAEHNLYESLALLAQCPKVTKAKRKISLKLVKTNQKKMRKWAAHAPENFANKYFLVEAETCRIKGNAALAIKLYAKAIALSQKNGFLIEEAVANELAGKLCLSTGMKEDAGIYMRQAHYAYERWGAKIKTRDLEEIYPQLLLGHVEEQPRTSFGVLDYEAVVSSLQAISTEIILPDLLKTLMQIVIEDAGAERGCFVSVRKDDLYMEAQADIGQHEVAVFKSMRIEEKEDLALSVANYVRQTKDVVVLDNATERGDFTTDPYVLEKQPKSILCLPVIRQSKLVGILYLENNVATGAFTPDRIEILKLLASQAAISVENARLYENVLHNERALRESEEKYRTILESIEDGYYEVDTSGNFRLVNDSLCRIFGYLRNALIGMNYSQLMDEQNAENIKKTFKEVFTTAEPVKGFDNDFTRKDGVQINNELSVSLIKDSKGNKIGFRGIVRDITSRKRTAEELRMHRDHLEELVKERTVELLKANEKLKEEIKARMAAEKELMQYRDQLELLVKKRTVQLTAANEQLRQEIKDRKRAEGEAKLRQEQLFQAAKMASLGTLVSGVAHEINNPISFITLNAPILQKAWQGVTPILDNHCQANGDVRIANLCYTELRKRIPLLLLGITEGGRRVKAIVRDLKEFARQSPPELTDMVDLNRTAKTAVGLVSNMIKKSTNHFSEVYEAHLPVIKGNAQRIEQVIINLLVNACQSLSDKERGISLSTAYKKTSECLIIKIRDQGAGMSSDVLDRIRDPFFTTKRDSGGTGLGLAISDRIVADHGGSMVFDSAPDEGTVVRVCFPIVQPPKKEARF